MGWLGRSAFLAFVFLTIPGLGESPKQDPEPEWQPALAYGGAPECPKHLGKRTYRSDVVGDAGTVAFIVGLSSRSGSGCRSSATIHLTESGRSRTLIIPGSDNENFSIVDFSPDGSELLLEHDHRTDDFHQLREVSIALVPIASGLIEWHNAWDLFGWKNCVAMVEPQGFLPDGRVVLRARRTVMVGDTAPNCVKDIGLYAASLNNRSAVRLADSTKVVRYGERLRPGFQACKSDPDIVGECFTVHGRLSAWNGTPTMRIWRIGTKRILGVHDDIMPESLTFQVGWDVDAYGDFQVCPFTKKRPGEMQMVCIEQAKHLLIKKD